MDSKDGAAPEPVRGPVARLLAREAALLRETLRSWATRAAWLWARRPPPARTAAIAFCAALAVAGATAILAQVRLPERLPSARDWTAVRALLERDARPGDAVALAPAWVERARQVLPVSLPVLAMAHYGGEDLLGVRRIWLLSLPRAPRFSFDVESELLQRAARSDPAERVGAIEVTRYDLAFPAVPIAFLPDRLASAEVSRAGVACATDGSGGFGCGGPAPVRITREVRELAGAPRPCIVTTLTAGAPLSVAFPPVRVGRIVRGHAGALRAGGFADPLRVSVLLDGDEVGAVELAGAGFVPFEIDTTRSAGTARRISVVLSSPAPDVELCLDLVTLP